MTGNRQNRAVGMPANTPDAAPGMLFLPDLCGVRALLGVIVIGELLAVVLTLASTGIGPSSLDRLSLVSLFTQWIGLSAAAVLCVSRRILQRLPEVLAAIVSYLLILSVVYGVSEAAWLFVRPLAIVDPVIGIERGDFLARTLGISAIVGALVLRYFYLQHHWKLRTVSEARARLEALQARIRPHFLFNCMNTIASLTRTDARAAERAIEDLADLFRASIGESTNLSTLDDEFELVRGYLSIEALRLGDRLRTHWDVDTVSGSVRIPQLTLQPLVENAIYHGIEPLAEGGVIEISAHGVADDIALSITNPRAAAGASRHRGNQLAQENVAQRLAAYFGDRGRLEIEIDDTNYRVTVRVPAEFQP